MQSSKSLILVTSFLLLQTLDGHAAHVDMTDPRRALGRDDDIRIDAQLLQQQISQNSPLSVTYQVENLGKVPIAVADRVSEIDYDADTRTVVLSVGAEIPDDKAMPHLVLVRPGEKRVFSGGGTVRAAVPRLQTPWTAVPRYVQIKVVVLRDVTPFARFIDGDQKVAQALPPDLFDRWVESTDSVFLNPIPVQWNGAPARGVNAESATIDAGGGF